MFKIDTVMLASITLVEYIQMTMGLLKVVLN